MIVIDLFSGSCMVSASVGDLGHTVRLAADVGDVCVKDVPTATIDLDEPPSDFVQRCLSDVDFKIAVVFFNCYETRFIKWSIEFVDRVKPRRWCMSFKPQDVVSFVRDGISVFDVNDVHITCNMVYRSYGVAFKGSTVCVSRGCSAPSSQSSKRPRQFEDRSLGTSLDYLVNGRNKMRLGIGKDVNSIVKLLSPSLCMEDGLALYRRESQQWIEEKKLDNDDLSKLLYFNSDVLGQPINLSRTTVIPRIVVSLLDI